MLDAFFDAFSEFLDGGRRDALARYLDGDAEVAFLDVYRNGFLKSCIGVLRASYPSVERLTGETRFTSLARLHVDAHPPPSACLAEYGTEFPAMIDKTRHLHGIAHLGCVARLDRAWTETYFAADDTGAEPDALAGMSENAIAQLRGRLVPRARLVSLEHRVLDAWAHLRADVSATPESMPRAPQYALIWRCHEDVAYRSLTRSEHALIAGIDAGKSFAEGALAALEHDATFDVAVAFASLLAQRMLILEPDHV